MQLYVFNFLIILAAFVLHNTLGIYFKIGPVAPDLTLVALASLAFIGNPLSGTSSGFFAGILKDLVALRGFGVNALTHTLLGYIAGALEASIIANSLILMAAVAITTLISHLFYTGIAFLLNYQIDYLFWKYAIIGAIYNALISPFVYLPINNLFNKMTSKASFETIKDGKKKT